MEQEMTRWRKRTIMDMARESWLDVYGLGHDKQSFVKALEAFEELVRADEREACAKVVEIEAMQYSEPVWAFEIVNDIRARGQA